MSDHNKTHKSLIQEYTTKVVILLMTVMMMSVMTGCKLGQRYQRPDLNMPEDYIDAPLVPLADMKWWEVYSDSALKHMINLALEQNKDILASASRMEEMAERKKAIFAQFFPNFNGQVYAQKEGLNYGGDSYTNNPEHGMKLSVLWELDIWGGKRWRHDRANAQWREAVETRRYLMVSIISDVAIAYYELVALDNELETVQSTLNARKESLDTAEVRYAGGLITETALKQAQVEYARTATLIPEIERDIKYKENELSYLCGQYPGSVKRQHGFGEDLITDTLPEQLSSKLLERRPDIRAAEQQLIAANADVGIAYTNRFPNFSLLASGGLESDELKTLLKSPMHLISPSIDLPIFDLGKLNAEYKATKNAYKAEIQDYEKTVLAAFREVSDALSAFNKSKDIYTSMKALYDVTASAETTAETQYLNGDISYLDLIDARRNLFDAQLGVINAIRDKHLALVTLYKALGGGWEE